MDLEVLADKMEVKKCVCGEMPVKETKVEMLGKIQDGGYEVTIGRYVCPSCGRSPSWGQSYSVFCGWNENVCVWNKFVSNSGK